MKTLALGRYHLRAELGRGTMGVVYRAYDPVLEREIALKTVELAPGLDGARREAFLARFFQEARIAGRLLHPNIVVTHDAATDEATGVPFIAMELVSGGSLADRLADQGSLGWRDAVVLAVPLARALDYAHQQGVVHRDVKPANVMLTEEGAPKIADFGIARLPTSELTQTGAVLGTPYFMSPEQLEADDVDGRSDLFSLGALLYTLVAGRSPFSAGDLAAITHKVLYKDPPPLSESIAGPPEALDGVLARTLAKKREERYATCAELASELERLLRGERPLRAMALGERTLETPARPQRSGETSPASGTELVLDAPKGSHRRGRALALLLLLLAGALAALALPRWERIVTALGPVAEELRARASELEDRFREQNAERERRRELEERARERLEAARAAFGAGRWNEALEATEASATFAREGELGPAEARALLLRGRILAETGAWSKARADLDAAGAIFEIYGEPEARAEAIVELADLERDLGDLERAESLYAQAAALGAGERVAFGRAVATLLGGDGDRARAELERLAASASGSAPRAELYLAGLVAAEGRLEDAEHHLARAEPCLTREELSRFRALAARLASKRGAAEDVLGPGPEDGGGLRFFFRGARETARSEALRARLPDVP